MSMASYMVITLGPSGGDTVVPITMITYGNANLLLVTGTCDTVQCLMTVIILY